MISRVANSCFWLHRYLERMDCTARLLDTNHAFVLDETGDDSPPWRPMLAAAGEEPRFAELVGAASLASGEAVQDYMTWDERNPSSIRSSAWQARENAVSIRETISLEAWGAINGFWLWLTDGRARRLYREERSGFYTRVKEMAQLFRGISADTMLHEEPLDFMRLGLFLERADQTARLMDVKNEMLGATGPRGRERAEELAEWVAILRSCSGTEPFLKRGLPFTGANVARFLLLDPGFPRSLKMCLERAAQSLARIQDGDREVGAVSASHIGAVCARLDELEGTGPLPVDLHDLLTELIGEIAGVGEDVRRDFFDPALPGAAA